MLRLLPFWLLMASVPLGAVAAPTPELVETYLAKGRAAWKNGDFEHAYRQCMEGITVLGSSYMSSDVEDDTGQKLYAASLQKEMGDAKNAASNVCRTLDVRISIYRHKQSRAK